MAMDFTQFTEKGAKKPEQSAAEKEWWAYPKSRESQIPSVIGGIVRHIRERTARIETQRQVSARLYGNLQLQGLQGVGMNRAAGQSPALSDRITYNVIQSTIDTLVAKITKSKPRPLYLTSGGNYKQQRKAKLLNKFVDGIFDECRVHRMSPLVFRDGCVYGDGFTHVFAENGRVKHERVLASELYVDDVEGFYGFPRQMHRVKQVDRAVLCSLFPEKERAIRRAQVDQPTDLGLGDGLAVADQLSVIESWHLPSGPEAGDGKHVITIPDVVLYSGPWERKDFPFARLPYTPPLVGYWSRGLAESIQNIQLEINKLLWLISRSMHLMGTFKIALEYGSKVNTNAINNEIGTIVYYREKAPMYLTPQVVPVEYYAQLERLKAMAYDQAGISQLSATSQKPAGLNSGVALREYQDVESDRFGPSGESYASYHLDLARLSIATAREIAERDGKFSVKAPAGTFLDEIDWKRIDLDESDYVTQLYPVSSLPQDPAGRLETVTEFVQAGFYSKRTAKKLLSFPDVEQEETLQNASEARIVKTLESILDGGAYDPPDPLMDLQVAKELALEYYNHAAMHRADEAALERLRVWNVQVDALTAAMAPPAPAPMPGQDAGAQGVPLPNPQSDLMPQVPTA